MTRRMRSTPAASEVLQTAFAVIMLCTMAAVAVSVFIPEVNYIAGALALLAMVGGILIAARRTRIVALIIAGVGTTALLVAWLGFGLDPSPSVLLDLNQDFITMIAAVGLLRLIAVSGDATPRLRGRAALVRTGWVVHLVGSVINVVVVGLAADRLRVGGRLALADASLLSRSFMTASIWTPFWVAPAVAASRVGETNLLGYTAIGFCIGMGLTAIFALDNARARTAEELRAFTGYTLSWRSAVVPMVLVVLIAIAHTVFPDTSVPRLVVVAVVLVVVVALIPREGVRALPAVVGYGVRNFASNRSETSILTSAGLLTTGLLALQTVTHFALPVAEFSGWTAWLVVVFITVLSLAGVHQFITFSIAASVIVPLQPEPTLFILSSTMGWAIGSIVGPLSGIANFLNGQYGVRNLELVRSNLPAAAVGLIVALPVLMLIDVTL